MKWSLNIISEEAHIGLMTYKKKNKEVDHPTK